MAKPQLVAKKNLILNGDIVFAGSDVPEGVPQHLLEHWAESGALEVAPVMVESVPPEGWEEPVRDATAEEIEWAKQQASTVWKDATQIDVLGDLEAAKQRIVEESLLPPQLVELDAAKKEVLGEIVASLGAAPATVESAEAPVAPVEAPVVAPKPTNKKRN